MRYAVCETYLYIYQVHGARHTVHGTTYTILIIKRRKSWDRAFLKKKRSQSQKAICHFPYNFHLLLWSWFVDSIVRFGPGLIYFESFTML